MVVVPSVVVGPPRRATGPNEHWRIQGLQPNWEEPVVVCCIWSVICQVVQCWSDDDKWWHWLCCHLVATLLTATWHLDSESDKGMEGSTYVGLPGLAQGKTLDDGDNMYCCHHCCLMSASAIHSLGIWLLVVVAKNRHHCHCASSGLQGARRVDVVGGWHCNQVMLQGEVGADPALPHTDFPKKAVLFSAPPIPAGIHRNSTGLHRNPTGPHRIPQEQDWNQAE